MLEINKLHVHYGKSHILQEVSLQVMEGETVTLLGRNGVGKTTTLKSIMGVIQLTSGTIIYKHEKIAGKKAHDIYDMGLGYIPQGRKIFTSLTVRENLFLGRGKKHKRGAEYIFDMFPILQQRLNQSGGLLSGGEQQMLAIARVLVCNPQMILLDEPTEGLAPLMVRNILDILLQLKELKLTLFLAEANLNIAIKSGDRHYVMDQGTVVCEAETDRLRNDNDLLDRYFRI